MVSILVVTEFVKCNFVQFNNKPNSCQTHQPYLVLQEWPHVSTPTGSSSGPLPNQVNETPRTPLGSQCMCEGVCVCVCIYIYIYI